MEIGSELQDHVFVPVSIAGKKCSFKFMFLLWIIQFHCDLGEKMFLRVLVVCAYVIK